MSASWSHDLIALSVRTFERNLVVVSSNPTPANFLKLLLKLIQWWIPYASIHVATHVITYARFCLKQVSQLTKAMVKMRREHYTMRWNWSSFIKLALSATWTHGLIAQSVRASECNINTYVCMYTYILYMYVCMYIYK